MTAGHTTAGAAADESAATSVPASRRKPARTRRLTSPLGFLGVCAVLSVGLAAGLYLTEQRPDVQTDSAVAKSVVKTASKGAAAVLSYAPTSLDSDLEIAKSYLTGDFLAYYSKFSNEVLRPTAKEKHIKTKTTVVQAALSELHPHSAKVLVFVNQMSTSKEKPMVAAGNSVIVSLVKTRATHGAWLISGFDPI